jgi:single-strand DNA-binding protein
MSTYVDVIGNLTRDPELKTLRTNTVACDMSIASNSMLKDKDGNRKAVFFSVRIFGKHGESCAKYLTKGSKVYARGEFNPVDYKAQDGQEKTIYTINNASIEFLNTTPSGGGQQATGQYKKAAPAPQGDEDDLPF